VERLAQLHTGVEAAVHPGARRGDPARRHGLSFAALRSVNYRWYFAGQSLSSSGTWIQQTAVSWLVLELGGTATDIGIVAALQFLPLLTLGPIGGVIVDRFPRRKLLLITSVASTSLAAGLAAVTAIGEARLWVLFAFSLLSGVVTIVDNPARQVFAAELVSGERLASAIGLNGVVMNGSRAVGPALAGLVIETGSMSLCFAINAVSYVAIIVALIRIDPSQLTIVAAAPRERHGVRDGWRYVKGRPAIAVPLAIMAVVGMLSLNFPTILPVLAKTTFNGDAGTFGVMSAVMSVGAIAGALFAGSISRPSSRAVAVAATVAGILIAAAAAAPSLVVEDLVLVPVGFAVYAFVTLAMTAVQLGAEPQMRGRVMALWAMAFAGTTPIGGPAVGALAQALGARVALGEGATAAVVSGAIALVFLAARRSTGSVTSNAS
jgi:MFS family permease